MSRRKEHTKRIGLVLSQVPGYSETFFRNKIIGLQSHGYEVILFVDSLSDEDSAVPCSVLSAPDFSKKSLRFVFSLTKCLLNLLFFNPRRSWKLYRLNRNDGIRFREGLKLLLLNQHFLSEHLEWLHFGFGTLAKGRENVAQAIHAKMGVSFRGFDLYLSPLKHPNCFDLLFTKDVKYHVLAEEMKQVLIEQGVKKEQVTIITPAIDVNFFSCELQRNLSLKQPIRFTTIARLHWKKGLDYTLEALALLKAKGFYFHYTVVGTGDQYERLVFAVHQLGLQNEVSFLGKLSPQEVKKIYKTTDIYLQYSVQEGFCNAVLEAQAMGLLCVVSDAEGLSENVLHEKTGWVVPKRKPESLVDCLVSVLNMSSTSLQSVRLHATERARAEFNLEKQMVSFLRFYEE